MKAIPNAFNSISVKKPKRSLFDLSHETKGTMEFGQLIPFLCEDVIPGDKWRCNSEVFIRFQPLVFPTQMKCNCYTHYFFVPYRLLWKGWEDFITGEAEIQLKQNGSNHAVPPYFMNTLDSDFGSELIKFLNGSLGDYLGFPTNQSFGCDVNGDVFNNQPISAFPFLAYQKIYSEFYRDENLDRDIFSEYLADGDLADYFYDLENSGNLMYVLHGRHTESLVEEILKLRTRAWRKDYFTSALQDTQRGGDVTIPVGDVILKDFDDDNPKYQRIVDADGNPVGIATTNDMNLQSRFNIDDARLYYNSDFDGSLSSPHDPESDDYAFFDPNGTLQVGNTTINDLRKAFQLQTILEKLARCGHRYVEFLQGFFGVNNGDLKMQRPKYLGGGVQPVQVSSVIQTSQSSDDSALGEYAGHAIVVGNQNGFQYDVLEHGIIMGIMSVIPEADYFQGIPKAWQKLDRFDYYLPQFAHIGEVPVKMKELVMDDSKDEEELNKVFGYQPIYSEYREIRNSIHGDLRGSLIDYHLARVFPTGSNAVQPGLNSDFVHVQASELNRIFAVTDDSAGHLIYAVNNNIKALRPIPVYGTPRL